MSEDSPELEACVGCGAVFPMLEGGTTHRYMDSSAACWAAFGSLNDPERPLEAAPFNALMVDAYAAQHPGTPSNQAVNSVAIHLMVLYGVLERDFQPAQALWLRMRPGRYLGLTAAPHGPGRPSNIPKHERFHWLTPPSFASSLTVADVVAGETPLERSSLVEAWVKSVWAAVLAQLRHLSGRAAWAVLHHEQVEAWFEKYVLSERF